MQISLRKAFFPSHGQLRIPVNPRVMTYEEEGENNRGESAGMSVSLECGSERNPR